MHSLNVATLIADSTVLSSLEVLGDLKVDGKTELVGDVKTDGKLDVGASINTSAAGNFGTTNTLGNAVVRGVMVGAVALSTNNAVTMYATSDTYPTGNTYSLSAGTVSPSLTGNTSITINDPLVASTTLVLSSNNVATQSTNITTAVTSNGPSGFIITQTSTLAAQGSQQFTFNNSRIKTGSAILVSINGYGGTLSTNGIPVVNIITVTAGACDIAISNSHATNALNGALNISFLIC